MSASLLFELAVDLDVTLTGKDRQTAQHNARQQAHLFDDLWAFVVERNPYYLSDGGYSRVVVTDEGKIWLTSNSTDRVKEAWNTPAAKTAVSRFRDAVMESLQAAIDSEGPRA